MIKSAVPSVHASANRCNAERKQSNTSSPPFVCRTLPISDPPRACYDCYPRRIAVLSVQAKHPSIIVPFQEGPSDSRPAHTPISTSNQLIQFPPQLPQLWAPLTPPRAASAARAAALFHIRFRYLYLYLDPRESRGHSLLPRARCANQSSPACVPVSSQRHRVTSTALGSSGRRARPSGCDVLRRKWLHLPCWPRESEDALAHAVSPTPPFSRGLRLSLPSANHLVDLLITPPPRRSGRQVPRPNRRFFAAQ